MELDYIRGLANGDIDPLTKLAMVDINPSAFSPSKVSHARLHFIHLLLMPLNSDIPSRSFQGDHQSYIEDRCSSQGCRVVTQLLHASTCSRSFDEQDHHPHADCQSAYRLEKEEFIGKIITTS